MKNNDMARKISLEESIGVIDSGVGGLTVASELMRQLPKEKIIYLGDTLRCPYGPRSPEEIKKFTHEMVAFLLQKKIKMLVIACNTATAYTLTDLQKELNIPVIGVIKPGARAAIKVTNNYRIGVIGTEGTIRSNAYSNALKNINSDIHVNALACPMFVPMVEQGIVSGKKAYDVVEWTLAPIRKNNHIDTLILGCTHYPIIKDTIQTVIGNHVSIISSSEETARETSAILEFNKLLYKGEHLPKHQFYATGNLAIFKKIIQTIFGETVDHFLHADIEKAVLASAGI